MYDLAKVSENNNHDLSKVSKVTKKQFRIAQNMKTTNIICPKSVKMTSNLVDFEDLYVTFCSLTHILKPNFEITFIR